MIVLEEFIILHFFSRSWSKVSVQSAPPKKYAQAKYQIDKYQMVIICHDRLEKFKYFINNDRRTTRLIARLHSLISKYV